MSGFREEAAPVIAMAALFIISIGIAMFIALPFKTNNVTVFQDPNSVANPLIYLVVVVVFTLFILVLARLKLKAVIRYIILIAVFLSLIYVVQPLVAIATHEPPLFTGDAPISFAVAIVVSVLLVVLLRFRPEWYIIDGVGIAVSAGAAALFGVSLGILPALVLLIAFAAYDAIAVYQTKHMIDLADSVMDLHLPLMFVIPKQRGYSFLAERDHLKDQLAEKKPREAMFLGLGDVVIPGTLVVAALVRLNWFTTIGGLPAPLIVAVGTLLGVLAGFLLLMIFVLRGNPQAGLPSLNGGAIVGFLLFLIPLYGLAPVLDPIRALLP
ncbi:MAG: presenilin family intramembrane aspartyl protease PSH [Thermoplasmatota archaeon]